MSGNANSLQSVPASRSAREFVAVCARHNVPYGDLNCLPTLLRELKVNKHFAMHFWSVVVGQLDKAAEQDAVFAAVVEAVTGRTPAEVREAGPSQRILLEKLQRLLNGQDAEPGELVEAGTAEITPSDKRTNVAPPASTAVPGVPAEDVLPIRRVSHGKRRRAGRRVAIEHEQVSPVTNPAWTRDESLRLVLVPEPPISGNHATAEPLLSRGVRPELRSNGTRLASVPLSSYAEEKSRQPLLTGIVVIAIIAAVLAGGGYMYRHGWRTQAFDRLGTSVRAGYGSAVAAWKGNPAENPAGTLGSSSSTSAQPPEQPTAPVAAAATSSITPAPHSTASAPSSAAAAIVPVSQTTTPAQPPAQKVRDGRLTPEQSMAVAAAYNQMHEGLDLAAPAADGSSGLVKVPEGEMNAHLIASRVPVLPDDARANGITGVVRMQATISRNGYVSRLHVLQGPTELRPAALSAVEAWRYRPYLVNGQPMDVSTTITVDFSSLE